MSVSLISVVTGAIIATAVIVAISLLTDFPERVVKLTQVELRPEPSFSHAADSSAAFNPSISQRPTPPERAYTWIWRYIGLPIAILGGVLLTIFLVEFTVLSIQIPGLGSVQEQGFSPIGLFYGIFAFVAVLVIALVARHRVDR